MRHFTRFSFLLLIAGAAFVPWHSQAQERPKGADAPTKEPSVMQRKLAHAQGVLSGLALNDFDRIDKEADALIKVREEVTWKLNETEKYLRHSLAFLEHLQDLKKAAKAKNLDAATLAYLDMTRTCVKCHETLRAQKMKGED
jgi:hypothetical protein